MTWFWEFVACKMEGLAVGRCTVIKLQDLKGHGLTRAAEMLLGFGL